MPTKLQFDAERWLRNNADIYTRMGSPQISQNMLLCADEIKKLRMAVDPGEQGAEHMRDEVARLKGEIEALVEAVAWERECEELHGIITELYCNVAESAPEEDEVSRTYFAARAEVDRLLGGE